jgi:transposase-like protein
MRWLDAITAIGCLKRSWTTPGSLEAVTSGKVGAHGSRKAHPAELRERAVAMVFEVRAETGNARGAIARVGHRPGINTENLRNWVQKTEVDSGRRARHDE